MEKKEFQRCSDLLSEAIEVNPDNAYLWVNLGACQMQLGKTNDVIVSISKAVELMPQRGPFRVQLAQLLEKENRLDEAEKHFRRLLTLEPDNPVVHFWLAEFLVKHRPAAADEALKEAQIAFELPAKGGLKKQDIKKLIEKIQSQKDGKTALGLLK